MLSLSKARVLNSPKQTVTGVKEFVYGGRENATSPGPADWDALPANTEPLWAVRQAVEEPGPEKKYTEEDLQAREQQAWQRGVQEAGAHARENMEKSLAEERARLAEALNEFSRERENYFRNVEGEVVRLVLAVARKVLHREAQVDPLLLTGVVRVALEQIAVGTHLKLRVPAEQADSWQAAVKPQHDNGADIEIIGDSSLKGPECLVVTEAGTTDLSVEGQLAEIEQGFLDLLSQRPANSAGNEHVPSYAA